MAWVGVVTNAGQALLSSYAEGGHSLSIDGATVGSGVVAEANLRIQTAVADERDDASIVRVKTVTDGAKYEIQVGPTASTAYTAHQIGLWASLDDGESTLILLAQDSGSGIDVPVASGSPKFSFSLMQTLAVDNTGTLTVNIDESAYVNVGTFQRALADKVDVDDIENDLEAEDEGKVLDARQGAVLKALIDHAIMIGQTTTIAAGTTTKTLNGLTADHRVCFWGFSSGGENDPPADITVTTAANSYTITVSNVVNSGVTMTPVFILPQN